jgi:hypothetical protein
MPLTCSRTAGSKPQAVLLVPDSVEDIIAETSQIKQQLKIEGATGI